MHISVRRSGSGIWGYFCPRGCCYVASSWDMDDAIWHARRHYELCLKPPSQPIGVSR